MANHGYVTTRRHLTPEEVDRDIREIVKRRFKDLIEVRYEKTAPEPSTHNFRGTDFWNIWALWAFEPKDEKLKKTSNYIFEVWIMNRRKLEFRHPHGDWSWWGQMTVQNELAYKYDGTISDEGVEERWKVDQKKLDKYRHYRDWVTKRWPRQTVAQKAARAVMARLELSTTPEPLRSL